MENQCMRGGHCECKGERACDHPTCASRRAESCLTEHAVETWTCAGHQAWKEIHVDILKVKIMKAWGPQMEKTADAVIEAMSAQWQAAMTQDQAKNDLKQKIHAIFSAGSKQS